MRQLSASLSAVLTARVGGVAMLRNKKGNLSRGDYWKMKSAKKNACGARRNPPKPNSAMPDPYLDSVLTCGNDAAVNFCFKVAIFFFSLAKWKHLK